MGRNMVNTKYIVKLQVRGSLKHTLHEQGNNFYFNFSIYSCSRGRSHGFKSSSQVSFIPSVHGFFLPLPQRFSSHKTCEK